MTWEKYTEIPLDVFREMELKMKNELHFEITELGKSLTYSALFWSQCPKGRAEALPEEETDDSFHQLFLNTAKKYSKANNVPYDDKQILEQHMQDLKDVSINCN